MNAASEEKAKRREKQLKEEAAAQKRKAKEAEEAAKPRLPKRRGSCRRITIHAHTALALRSVRISRAKEPRKSGAPSR